jgi:hypothetical protein
MTYTDHHTKARPSKWVGGHIVGFELCTRTNISIPIWADKHLIVTDATFNVVLVVARALDKMTH